MATTTTRKQLGAAARREGILAAALAEFARHGYDRTRASDIAERVGVTEPVVFQNFGSKAGLFAAVLERASQHAEAELGAVFDTAPAVHDALARLLSAEYHDRMHSPGAMGAVFADAAAHPEPGIRKAGHRAHQRLVTVLAEALRGSVRPDADPAAAAALVLSLVHARQLRCRLGRTSPALERDLAAAVVGIIEHRG